VQSTEVATVKLLLKCERRRQMVFNIEISLFTVIFAYKKQKILRTEIAARPRENNDLNSDDADAISGRSGHRPQVYPKTAQPARRMRARGTAQSCWDLCKSECMFRKQ
jgi:hypothetical protein